MRYWDSSAVVPLVIDTALSGACRRLWNADPVIATWALTHTEGLSALHRRHRAGELERGDFERGKRRLSRLVFRSYRILDLEAVREMAERVLENHSLRAADALQLAAALVAVDSRPRGRGFVCLDDALLEAARREGFDFIRPT